MRLTCPKCGATYALGAEAVPPGGSHVQCGACHTRWFVRPDRPAPDALSEDQIVERLESRAERTPAGDPAADETARTAPIAFPGPMRPVPVPAAAPAPEPRPAEPAAAGPGPALSPAAAATPLRPRAPAERPVPVPPPASVEAAPAAQGGGRAVLGFVAAAALAGLALGAYLRADAVPARAPAAAPALAAYAEAVDAGRAWIEERLGPLRDRLLGG